MENRVRYLYALPIIALIGILYLQGYNKEPKYSRQECIQLVTFDWDGYSQPEIENIINEISEILRSTWLEKNNDGVDIPDHAFPFNKRNEWYLQYHNDCHEKKNKTIMLIKNTLAPNVKRFPSYKVTDELILPSTRTIYITGEFWKKDDF